MTITTRETGEAAANCHVHVYDAAVLRYHEPCWDALPGRAQLQAIRDLQDADTAGPAHESHDHNTTCIELDELRTDALDETTPTEEAGPATAIVVGDDNTTPAYSDRSLNNQVAEVDIAEYDTSNGTEIILNAVLGTEQGNDATSDLVELGTITTDGRFLNHSLFTPFTKNNNRACVFEVTITFTNQ